MTLKHINLSPIAMPTTKGIATSQPPIETGALALSTEGSARALERMLDETITVHQRTTMVEDGVSTLVPLQAKLNKDYEIVGYHVNDNDATNDDLIKAYHMAKSAMTPLPKADIMKRIGVMAMVITVPKDFSPKVLAMKTEVLAEKLADYPADILLKCFDYIEKHNKFWPTLSEFHEYMSWQVKPRKLMCEQLQKCIDKRTNLV